MITLNDFLDAGYKKFPKSQFRQYAEFGLQKCVRDDIGKKYYITVWVYPELKEHNLPQQFEPDIQFSRKGKPTLNIQFILNHNTTIQEIEEEIETLWRTTGAEHYERYDE